MNQIVLIIQIIISLILIVLILLQSQGTGLGSVFGGASETYRSRRGVEKILYRATVMSIVLFFIICLLSLILK